MKVLQIKTKNNTSFKYVLIDDDFKPVLKQTTVFNVRLNKIENKGLIKVVFSQHRLNALKRIGQTIEIFNEKQVSICKNDVQKKVDYENLLAEQQTKIKDFDKVVIDYKNKIDDLKQLVKNHEAKKNDIISKLKLEIHSLKCDIKE